MVRILEAGQTCDVNLIIALILSRQLGWPIDFVNDDSTVSFVLVVPASPFAGSEMLAPSANTGEQLVNKAMTPAPTAGTTHAPLRKPPSITYD